LVKDFLKMNALCYKIVFSKRLGSLVAVGEHTAGQGKAAGTGVRTVVYPSSSAASADNFVGLLKSVFASVALSFVTVGYATAAGPAVNTLPTGAQVKTGNVAISATGTTMNINQTTDKASVNWNSFSIGKDAKVNVVQNSAKSVLLNRVVGNDPSQIFGKLTAKGQVILINPNGVVFGKDGSVTASAFTASTFGMTDADFLAGKHKFSRNGSTAGVTVENGATINTTAPGGYVALIGASVDNQGAITTKEGAVVLAAGESVALPAAMTDSVGIPLSSKVRLELAPSTINASVENGGTITTEGGQVLMQAAALSDAVASITHTGTIDTTGAQGGAVHLLADGGQIKVVSSIKANSTSAANKGGDIIIGRDTESGVLAKSTDVSNANLESNKGFVETSGDYLVTKGILVKAAEWLLDPSDITISNNVSNNVTGTSIVQVSTIEGAINQGTSVTIKTTNGSNPNGAGNITIADALNFNNTGLTDATLSLIADNGITQNAAISATGSKLVHIKMESKGQFRGLTGTNSNSQGMTLNRAITTNGDVTLTGTVQNTGSSNAITFNDGSGITARKYTVVGIQNGTANSSQGIVFSGTTSFKQTGTEDSSILGTTKGGSWPPSMGIYYLTGSNTTFDSGTGTTKVVGKMNGDIPSSYGTRAGFIGGANITTHGNVTLGSNEPGASFFHRAGTIKAASGILNILGSSIETYDPTSKIEGANGTTINLSAPRISLGSSAGGSSQIAPTPGSDSFTLNISADLLVVQPGSQSSSGTNGTTTVKNFNAGTKINLVQTTPVPKPIVPGVLTLNSSDIASFTSAGNLVFGSDTAGDIDISTAISLNKIRITSNGDINIKAALTATTTKTNELSDAIVIIAGKDKTVDDPTGGNIKIGTGGAINVQQGGVAKLFTGSTEEDKTVIHQDIAATGSGKFRYNSDENTSNFTKELGVKNGDNNGVNVIYREAPTIELTAKSTLTGLTYNGATQTGTEGVNDTTAPGILKNGDANAILTGTLAIVHSDILNSTNTNPKNAGTYDVTASGQTSALGYKVSYKKGSLVIDKKAVTPLYEANTKVFDGNTNAVVTATLKDIIAGDKVTANHTSAKFASPDVGTNISVTVEGITLSGADASNYKINPATNPGNKATATASITARPPAPPTPVVPTNNAGGRVKIPTGSGNPFALASAEDLADDTCSANSIENCHCEESTAGEGVSICYEPKAGGKGAAR
jgi:filamentous hemagglutinin family protein